MAQTITSRSKGSAKNDEYQILDMRKKIARGYLEGKSQLEIAKDVGCTIQNISYHLGKIREEWLKTLVSDFDERKAKEVAKIDNLEEEAWAAFTRSCQNAETLQTEQDEVVVKIRGEDGLPTGETIVEPGPVTTKRTSRGQAGDPRFLDKIAWCIDMRCKIFGIYKEQGATINQLILNFDDLYGKPDEPNRVEQRLQEIAAGKPTRVVVKAEEDE
jgi:hypothetical protein